MGSIDIESYNELLNELKENLDLIIRMNQQVIKNSLKMNTNDLYSQFMGYLEVPSDSKYIYGIHCYNYINNNDFKVWIMWNHYILLEFTHDEMKYKLLEVLDKQYGNKVRPLQRRWREYYYHPEGPFMKKYGKELAEKYGMAY